MREFAKSEIIRQKCGICGSKNKMYTEILFNGNPYGYMLTCCNCGHIDTFMDSEIGSGGLIRGWMREGKRICIQLTSCKKKDCPLHGTSKLWDDSTDVDSSTNNSGNGNSLTDNMCGNPTGSDKNSQPIELDVNSSCHNCRRFR